ncbi:hypothetical protein Mgra_00007926 [Meloidogyne graminicola]|uniref:Uncharacterized protein n=1 Tax=Meloidogyne graminicola TaxID=189291 RepID=A0A8S9ZHF9_9BILA|nr:hypothetical protein Mgra_00007926 [Meloidogyne graminicola]
MPLRGGNKRKRPRKQSNPTHTRGNNIIVDKPTQEEKARTEKLKEIQIDKREKTLKKEFIEHTALKRVNSLKRNGAIEEGELLGPYLEKEEKIIEMDY